MYRSALRLLPSFTYSLPTSCPPLVSLYQLFFSVSWTFFRGRLFALSMGPSVSIYLRPTPFLLGPSVFVSSRSSKHQMPSNSIFHMYVTHHQVCVVSYVHRAQSVEPPRTCDRPRANVSLMYALDSGLLLSRPLLFYPLVVALSSFPQPHTLSAEPTKNTARKASCRRIRRFVSSMASGNAPLLLRSVLLFFGVVKASYIIPDPRSAPYGNVPGVAMSSSTTASSVCTEEALACSESLICASCWNDVVDGFDDRTDDVTDDDNYVIPCDDVLNDALCDIFGASILCSAIDAYVAFVGEFWGTLHC